MTPPPTTAPDPWWPHSLGRGAPGILMAHAARAHAEAGTWADTHAWAQIAVQEATANERSGLFQGAPAVAYALHIAGHPAYANALTTLDQATMELIERRLAAAHVRLNRHALPELAEFDLISGLTGLCAYLITLHPHTALTRDVLSYLVRLSEPTTVAGQEQPGWWSHVAPCGTPSPDYPGGHANLGLAHGIAGPLAALASAHRAGITVAGQTEAIDRILTWLDAWHQDSGARTWWPEWITPDEHAAGHIRGRGRGRPSWCYGAPGIARAYQVGAVATSDTDRQQHAENILAGCATDEHERARLSPIGLCHGQTGLVLTLARAAQDALTPTLSTLASQLSLRREPHGEGNSDPGFLDGQAGHNLAELALCSPPAPAWLGCLLLR